MPLLGQPDLSEVGKDRDLVPYPVHHLSVHRCQYIGLPFFPPFGPKELAEDVGRNGRKWKWALALSNIGVIGMTVALLIAVIAHAADDVTDSQSTLASEPGRTDDRHRKRSARYKAEWPAWCLYANPGLER